MSIVREPIVWEIDIVTIENLSNVERYITKIFDEVGKHNLESVKKKDDKLILTFSEKEDITARNFVKQLSKKKYPTSESLVKYYASAPRNWRLLKTLETPKVYLLFFSEICRETKDIIW